MKNLLLSLLAFLPSALFAQELVFECGGPESKRPELRVVLTKSAGGFGGNANVDGTDIDVMVYPGVKSLTFLHIGSGYTMNYNVSLEDHSVSYTGSGSKMGFGRDTCVKTVGE